MRTRIVVIGSNCFTGSHVVSGLLASPEFEVLGISRSVENGSIYLPYKRIDCSRFRFKQIDIVREYEELMSFLDTYQPDFIINVAALSEVYQSHLTPNEYFDVNTTAVVRLGNELRARPWLRRYIHISSAEIYGNCDEPLKENAPLYPSTPYAASKAAADNYLLSAESLFGLPVTLVRSTNVYGRHQQLFKIIPRTIIYLKMNKTIELHGGGVAIRPFIHIRDVVDGILAIMSSESPAPIYHFSSAQQIPIHEIVSFVCGRMGEDPKEVTRKVGQRPKQDFRYWLDSSKAKKDFGWTPKVSFQKGVDETIQWINENWEAVQKEPLHYVHTVCSEKSKRQDLEPTRIDLPA